MDNNYEVLTACYNNQHLGLNLNIVVAFYSFSFNGTNIMSCETFSKYDIKMVLNEKVMIYI